MICQKCRIGNLEEISPATEDYPAHRRCPHCGAEGTQRDIQVQALREIDNRWSFYYCPELKCRCFYRETYHAQINPIIRIRVYCPRLKSQVTIEFLGVGEEGQQTLANLPAFPVNLHHRPYTLDPKPSRTMTEQLLDEWERVLEARKNSFGLRGKFK